VLEEAGAAAALSSAAQYAVKTFVRGPDFGSNDVALYSAAVRDLTDGTPARVVSAVGATLWKACRAAGNMLYGIGAKNT
jgi:hypothetical protein